MAYTQYTHFYFKTFGAAPKKVTRITDKNGHKIMVHTGTEKEADNKYRFFDSKHLYLYQIARREYTELQRKMKRLEGSTIARMANTPKIR